VWNITPKDSETDAVGPAPKRNKDLRLSQSRHGQTPRKDNRIILEVGREFTE